MNENESKTTLMGYAESHDMLEGVEPEEIAYAREEAQELAEPFRDALEAMANTGHQRHAVIFMMCFGDCLADAISELSSDPDNAREVIVTWVVNRIEKDITAKEEP